MGYHFLLQGIFLTQGWSLHLLVSPALQVASLLTEPLGKPPVQDRFLQKCLFYLHQIFQIPIKIKMNYLLKIKPLPKKDYPHIKILKIDITSSIAHCCSFVPGSTVALSYCPRGSAVKGLCSNWSPNLEKPAVATGLEKISFHSNSKEGKCQRTFKLPYNCTHCTG